MVPHDQFGHLLSVLEEGIDEDALTRGAHSEADEPPRAIITHLRDSPDAQITLLVLAWEMKADAIDDEAMLRDDLQTFADTLQDRFGINLLQTAAANPSALPEGFPTQLLPPTRN